MRLIEKDVRELSVRMDRLTTFEVLAAAFPCQSFSQAGSGRGFDDARGAMFFEIPRLIEEYRPEERPSLIVLENVPPRPRGNRPYPVRLGRQDCRWLEWVERRKNSYLWSAYG